MRTAFLFIGALVVGCSATTSETLKVRGQKPVSTAASPVSSAQPLAPVASPPKAWGVAFTRPCVGSLTPPIVSPDGKELAFCGRRFDAQSGAFIDTQSINLGALLASGRVLSNDYGEQGWSVATRGGKPTSSAAGSYSESLAISPAGKRFIALERGDVVLRNLEPIEEVVRVPLAAGDARPSVGFLADERAVVFAPIACEAAASDAEAGCAALSVVDASGLKPLLKLPGVIELAIAQSGARAVALEASGARSVIALAGGEAIMKLPARSSDEAASEVTLAIDARGDHVVLQDEDTVVYDIASSSPREVARLRATEPKHIRFAPDGLSVYLADFGSVVVLREGASEQAKPTPQYEATVPKGFHPVATSCPLNDGDNGPFNDELCRARQHVIGSVATLEYGSGSSRVLPDGHVRAFSKGDGEMEVFVTAIDANQFVQANDQKWAEQIVAADTWDQAEPGVKKGIRFTGPRSFEYAEFLRHGCDPMDIYVRVVERDGWLFEVKIEVPPGTSKKKLQPLFEAFFDAPFASTETQHLFAAAPPMRPGPC